jgi:hypothetical protein
MRAFSDLYDALMRNAAHGTLCDCALRVIDATISSPMGIAVIWHPLGFANIKYRIDRDTCLRIHVWPRAQRQKPGAALSGIHDHTWDLRSWVLAGRLTNRRFEMIDASEHGATHEVVDIEMDGPVDRLSATGSWVTLRTVSCTSYGPGDSYDVEAGSFHATEIDARPVVTAVIGNERLSTKARTVEPRPAASREMVRVSCTPSELLSVMTDGIDALSKFVDPSRSGSRRDAATG